MNQDELLQEIRKMFQTEENRSVLLKLMIEEIRLNLMKTSQKEINHIIAAEILRNEIQDIHDIIERNEKIKLMKKFGF